jgi:hypothetical protein
VELSVLPAQAGIKKIPGSSVLLGLAWVRPRISYKIDCLAIYAVLSMIYGIPFSALLVAEKEKGPRGAALYLIL